MASAPRNVNRSGAPGPAPTKNTRPTGLVSRARAEVLAGTMSIELARVGSMSLSSPLDSRLDAS